MAWRAAEIAESAANDELFWDAHVTLMSRSETLTEDDLRAVAERLDLTRVNANMGQMMAERARRRVQADVEDARASGVRFTPTFFITRHRAWAFNP
jgi:NhaA family Na+:H+ antiporter